jgi:septum formation protein
MSAQTILPLVLASTSPYRRDLLARLRVPFDQCAPVVDEAMFADESAPAAVLRLARAKAAAVAEMRPEAYVIGSDQMVVLNKRAVSKPGDFATAKAQLAAASGQTVHFYTGVCVRAPDGADPASVVTTEVTFRVLTTWEIERYLQLESPYDCAGAFKAELLGIALVERIASSDPTALIGLPLIAVIDHLRQLGVNLLAALPN